MSAPLGTATGPSLETWHLQPYAVQHLRPCASVPQQATWHSSSISSMQLLSQQGSKPQPGPPVRAPSMRQLNEILEQASSRVGLGPISYPQSKPSRSGAHPSWRAPRPSCDSPPTASGPCRSSARPAARQSRCPSARSPLLPLQRSVLSQGVAASLPGPVPVQEDWLGPAGTQQRLTYKSASLAERCTRPTLARSRLCICDKLVALFHLW